MLNNVMIQIFDVEKFGELRWFFVGDDVWFVAADVCKILDLNDVSKACSRLDDDEKGTRLIRTHGGDQDMLVVNEPGLYRLVFQSRKPNAKEFQRKVYHEILPSIRKTGSYCRPLTYLEALEQLVVKEKERLALEAKNKELQVTQDLYDTVTLKNKWYSAKTVTDVLNILGLGRTNFYRFLREQGIVTNKNQPMRKHIEAGLMRARFDEWLEQYIVSFSLKGLRYIFVKLIKAKKLPENITEEIWIEYCNEMESSEEK